MRFIISLSIVLIAFDATKIRRIKQALRLQDTLERKNFEFFFLYMLLLLLSIPVVWKKCKSVSLKLNRLFSKTQLKSICLAGNVFDRKSTPCAIQLVYMSSRISLATIC